MVRLAQVSLLNSVLLVPINDVKHIFDYIEGMQLIKFLKHCKICNEYKNSKCSSLNNCMWFFLFKGEQGVAV